MIRAALAALLLAAAPALAQTAPTDDQLAAFAAALEAAGCTIQTEAQNAAVQEQTGFDEATLVAVVTAMVVSGQLALTPDGQGLRLTTGACAN